MTQPATPPPSTAEQLAQIIALIAAQAAIREQLTRTAARAVALAFAAVTNFWDTAETIRAVTAAVRAVQTSQRRMASVTDAYLSRTTTVMLGARVTPVGAVDITTLRRRLPQPVIEALAHAKLSDTGPGPRLSAAAQDVIRRAAADGAVQSQDLGDVYGRLADNYRYLVSSGKATPEQALQQVTSRGEAMAETDIALADRAQAQAFLSQRKTKGLTGYRRVLQPELGSGAPPCGLCVVAADVVYSFEELMPIHARCRCTVTPVGSAADPGFEINRDDLKRIYDAAGGTGAAGLKTVRVQVNEHGELGPVLTYAQHRYRGPREVARTQTEDEELRLLDQLDSHQDVLEQLIARRQAGDTGLDEQIRWEQTKVRELDRRLPAA